MTAKDMLELTGAVEEPLEPAACGADVAANDDKVRRAAARKRRRQAKRERRRAAAQKQQQSLAGQGGEAAARTASNDTGSGDAVAAVADGLPNDVTGSDQQRSGSSGVVSDAVVVSDASAGGGESQRNAHEKDPTSLDSSDDVDSDSMEHEAVGLAPPAELRAAKRSIATRDASAVMRPLISKKAGKRAVGAAKVVSFCESHG